MPLRLILYRNFLLFLLFLISGCAVYHAQPTQIPLLTDKHELQVAVGGSLYSGRNASIAFAPINHLAFQAYGAKYAAGNYYYQGSIGKFWQGKSGRILEVYSGYGEGAGYAETDYNGSFNEGSINLYFAQINVGQKNFNTDRKIKAGFGLKIGQINAVMFNGTNKDRIGENRPKSDYEKYTSVLTEPSFIMRKGGQRLKVSTIFSFALIHSPIRDIYEIPYTNLNLGLTVQYSFKKKKQG